MTSGSTDVGSVIGIHIRTQNLDGEFVKMESPGTSGASGYTLVVDEKVAYLVKWGGVVTGVVVALTNAPLVFVATVFGGYVAKDMLQGINDAVSDFFNANHCNDDSCNTRPVLTALATAAGLYFFPLNGLTATVFSGIYGQFLGSEAREQVEKSLPAEEGQHNSNILLEQPENS